MRITAVWSTPCSQPLPASCLRKWFYRQRGDVCLKPPPTLHLNTAAFTTISSYAERLHHVTNVVTCTTIIPPCTGQCISDSNAQALDQIQVAAATQSRHNAMFKGSDVQTCFSSQSFHTLP